MTIWPVARLLLLTTALDVPALDARVQALLREQDAGVQAGVWLGGPEGEAWYALNQRRVLPAASAIKTSFLLELFAVHAGRLDAPLPGADAILDDDRHPAWAPFSAEQRREVREGLRGASVRRVGAVMMGRAPASNTVYNAAASLVEAVFGGPKALTDRLHARDPGFVDIQARRYMLTDRNRPGDNTATPRALAAVLQRLSAATIPKVDEPTRLALREAVASTVDPQGRRTFVKPGALESDPITHVRSGWRETPRGPVVFVVMTTRPGPGARPRPESGRMLLDLARSIERLILDASETRGP